VLIRIISIVFPLFAIAGLGYVIGRRTKPNLDAVNKLNMDVFVPALIFAALAAKDFRVREFLPLAAAALAVIVGSGVLGWAIARFRSMEPKTLVPPVMFNNCGNLGLPLAVLAFGEQALAPAIVLFMISNFLQFSYGVWLLDHNMRILSIWRVPSVLATILGLAVSASGLSVWLPLMQSIKLLGDIVIPLMLFSLGARLAEARFESWRIGVFGALARPLAGLLIAVPLVWLIDLPGEQRALLLLFAALPPAVLNYIFAERYHQEPEKVASMVLIGNLAAAVILPMVLAFALPATK
jgi:predicted permease